MSERPACGVIPLLIGVTGHRDLRPEEVPAIETTVRDLLRRQASMRPHCARYVVSPLAEGADQTVARVAITEGWGLLAILPMPATIYAEDFVSPIARDGFDELLRRAAGQYVVPRVAGGSWQPDAGEDLDRPLQYAAVGSWLARHMHVLIAIWDGTDSGKVGGTSDVVSIRLGRQARRGSHTHVPPGGAVAHVVAGRISTGPAIDPGACRLLYDPRGGSPDDAVLSEIDRFNARAGRLLDRRPCPVDRGAEWLFPESAMPPRRQDLVILRRTFAIADAMACEARRFLDRSWTRLYLLGWMAMLIAQLSPVLLSFRAATAGYLSMLLVAWVFFVLDKRRKWHDEYIDCRALAEVLRVQFFWRLAGVERSAPDEFMVSQRSVLAWVRSAADAVNVMADLASPLTHDDGPAFTAKVEQVRRFWITDQMRYFIKAAARDAARLQWRGRVVNGLFWSALTLTALQLVLREHPVAAILITMGFASAAFIGSHMERMAYSEQVSQYGRMAEVFDEGLTSLDREQLTGLPGDPRCVLHELGREALHETAAWVLLHRQRPLQVPAG